MHREQQHVLRRGSREKRGPENWPALEIERLPVASFDLRLKLILRGPGRVDDVQRDLVAPSRDLDRFGGAILIRRTQYGTPIDQGLDGAAQRTKRHRRSKPHREAEVVGGAGRKCAM